MKGILLVDQGTEEIKFSNIHFFFMKFEDLRCTHFFHLFSYIMLSSMLISAEHKVPVTRKISIWPDQKSLPIVHLVEHLVRAWFVARTLTKSSFYSTLGKVVYYIFLIIVMDIPCLIYWLIQSDWHSLLLEKGAEPSSCGRNGDLRICYSCVSPSTITALLVFFGTCVCWVIKSFFLVNSCVEQPKFEMFSESIILE